MAAVSVIANMNKNKKLKWQQFLIYDVKGNADKYQIR